MRGSGEKKLSRRTRRNGGGEGVPKAAVPFLADKRQKRKVKRENCLNYAKLLLYLRLK